jgi:magnesium-transporting ATPase (P-type)
MDPKGPTPIMISGANVVSGEGLMMATVVGKDSRAGKNFELIFSKDD